jgi:hypothetical protein
MSVMRAMLTTFGVAPGPSFDKLRTIGNAGSEPESFSGVPEQRAKTRLI